VSVVVDANLVAALLVPLPYSARAEERRSVWNEAEEELVAPTLMEYEVCSTLRKAILGGLLPVERAQDALIRMRELDIRLVPPSVERHARALEWAERLGRSRTYDAQYMALAEELRADFWTAELRLFNRARQLGISWVHSILAPLPA